MYSNAMYLPIVIYPLANEVFIICRSVLYI
jgi:hypothetical protein